MERPEPEVYDALKSEKLFGLWQNSRASLNIACSGRVTFVETRNGEVFNKDEGGKVSKLKVDDKEIIVSGLFGDSRYHYEKLDGETLEFLVGKSSGWMEHAKLVASMATLQIPDRDYKLTLKRRETVDCDSQPQTLNEVFKDMSDKLKKGEFEVVEP